MSISLLKEREEKVKICLKKKTDIDIKAKVNFILDVSGSMNNDIRLGKVQNAVERIFPIARILDDDKSLGMYSFSCSVRKFHDITLENYIGYVDSVKNQFELSGTYYYPFLKLIYNEFKVEKLPVFNIVITDGDNDDKTKSEEIIIRNSHKNVFWQFVGIGYSSFSFLERLDKLRGRINDNANFFHINDLEKITDKELYDRLLNEFPDFIKNYKNDNALINNSKKWYKFW